MTAAVVALQILLPLALLAWLAHAPAAGSAAYALQVGATAVVLLALWLVAMWAMPPWWLPWGYGACLVAIVAWQWRPDGWRRRRPGPRVGRARRR